MEVCAMPCSQRHFSRVATIFVSWAAIASCQPILPVKAIEGWEHLLGMQLEDEQKCILAGTLYVREMPVGNAVVLSGRARCFDGRQFDFSQGKPHLKFEIRACDPVFCSAAPESNRTPS
jgi:hypothetical protein